MKYIVTGSVGHISRPLAEGLVARGHDVSIITSQSPRVTNIESLGARALVGSVDDRSFLESAFRGADALYLMIPPNYSVTDWDGYMRTIADSYIAAVRASAVKYVVALSSVGAHLGGGAGPVDGVAYLENQLKKIEGLHLLALRPSYFYYNLHAQNDLIKQAGIMGANFGGSEDKILLTHPSDIAAVALDELDRLAFGDFEFRYISSDERSGKEIAGVLGKAINREGIPWVQFTDEQAMEGMLASGLGRSHAEGFVAMGRSLREGKMQEDYWKHKPAKHGRVKLEDFAKEFATAFTN